MALSRFVLPYADVGAGIRPSSGAKLFFYATGTSTFKSTFTDATGSTANTNPVIANANGVFPAIFFNGSFNVALKDSNDVQIWTADPVNSNAIATIYATTLDLIASEQASIANDIVESQGYTTKGDGGGAQWKQNGVTGQTVSQSPAQLGNALLNDGNGNQWSMLLTNTASFETFVLLEASTSGNVGQQLICRERSSAEYIIQPNTYSALAGDATLASGLVAALQVNVGTQITTVGLINSVTTYQVDTVINTRGFTTLGDGGSGGWKQNGVTGQTASQSPAQLGSGILNDGNGNQWALDISKKVYSKSLGCIADDTADDTLPLRAWLATGSNHYLSKGTHKTTGSLTKSGQFYKISGDGIQSSIIKSYGNYDTLILDNGATSISRISIRDIGIFADAGDKTSGASIKSNTSLISGDFTNVYVRHYFNAFVFNGCAKFYMTNISYDQFGRTVGTSGSNAFDCLSTTEDMVDWHLINIQGSGFETGGGHNISNHFSLRKFDGIYLSNSHFFYGDTVFDVNPVDGEAAASLLCTNVYFDTIRISHFRINTSTGAILKSYGFEGCTFRACEEGSSIQLLNTDIIDGFRVQGGTIRTNFGSGIQQSTSGNNLTGLTIIGVRFKDNNSDNDSLNGDIVVRSDASVINSNTFSGGGALGSCVRFFSGGDNNIATSNNMNASTCTTKIADGGTGNTTSGNIL
jgi:hypothetical protein